MEGTTLYPAAGEIVERATHLLNQCRIDHIPIIHVWTTINDKMRPMPHWEKNGSIRCLEQTKGHASPDSLTPLPKEHVIHKTFFSAFSNEELYSLLNKLNINTLYIAGIHLHGCIRSTILDAYQKGFTVIAVADAIGSDDPIHGAITKRYLEARTIAFRKVEELFKGEKKKEPLPIFTQQQRLEKITEEPPFSFSMNSSWRDSCLKERIILLKRVKERLLEKKEDFAKQMAKELGKPIRHAREEILRASESLDAIVSQNNSNPIFEEKYQVRFSPLGNIGLITPWNNPVAISVGKMGAALFYGNTVVWKSAPEAERISKQLANLFYEAGFSEDILRHMIGGKEVAIQLMQDSRIDAVSLSGSLLAGFSAVDCCSRRMIPLQAELGGNNASIVWRDADFQLASRQIVESAFGFAGQRCTAGRRVIIDADCYELFVKKLQEGIALLHYGDPLDEKTDIGPLISREKCTKLKKLIERTEAPWIYTDPRSPLRNPLENSFEEAYFPATLVTCDPEEEIAKEESFGPILVIHKAYSWNEAIELCNGVKQGLVAACFSSSTEKIESFKKQAKAGILKINTGTTGIDVRAPFSGWKGSGIGPPEHGFADREFYTRIQTTYSLSSIG